MDTNMTVEKLGIILTEQQEKIKDLESNNKRLSLLNKQYKEYLKLDEIRKDPIGQIVKNIEEIGAISQALTKADMALIEEMVEVLKLKVASYLDFLVTVNETGATPQKTDISKI